MQKKTVFPLTRFQKAGEPVRGEWINLSPQNTEGWTKVCSDCSKEELTVYPDWNNWSSLTYEPDYGTRNETARKKSADGNTYLGNVTVTGSPNAPKAAAFTEAMGTKLPAFYEALRKEEKEKLDIAERGNLSAEMLLEWKAENQQEAIKHIKKHYTKRFNSLPETVFNDVRERGFSPMDYGPLILLPDNSFELRSEEVEFRDQTWELFHFEYMDPRLAVLNLIMLFLLPCIFVLILLCIAAALLWSVIAYLLYSRRYDLEAYRKNLTGVLAHDLKTPLAVIYGNAENLRAHTHPEQADEYADRIMENVTHIDEMIAGVLGLAQLENGVMPERKETVDLTALLHTAFQRSADQMAQRGLTLTESGKMEIRGNTEMLTQLAENLAANAVQHAAEGGTITVTAEKKVLRICNPYTGELDEKAICEPFRRGDAARGMHSGSGLGLSIVQQIAALQKLRLRVTARDGVFTAELKRRR